LQFLSSFDAGTEPDGAARVARHTAKKHTAAVLRLVLEQAINKGWRTDNPARGIRIKVPKTKATIWEQKDVDCYVKAARDTGVPSIALIILLEWEIGQRLTDVRAFRPGAEYDAERGVFSFRQSKTDEPVSIEVSMGLRAMLAEAGDGHLFLFRNDRTGKAYTENRLSKTFAWVRIAAVKAGGRPLILKQLRHSCIVQLARAGCTVPEIAAITGHALTSVNSILSVYLPRDTAVARAAQVKRGIVSA
jgi:integrase